ncbi:MAG: dihydroneopterin aldolase [Nitrospira sp.]|nr:dihydroneopterin aldolase [Nitrospira sp.]
MALRLTGPKTIFDNASVVSQIVIEQLEFRGRCGVTPDERARPQPLAVDLELDCQFESAGRSDDLRHTVDYAMVAERVVELGTSHESRLLETLAERFVATLFDEFRVDRIKLWLRKLHPPIPQVTRSMGITVERTRLAQRLIGAEPRPASFLIQQLPRLPTTGKVLDVAAGAGRHTLCLASLGYQVEAVDRDSHALTQLSSAAHARNLTEITTRTVDLEPLPPQKPNLGQSAYDVILVFFYLTRPLFPHIIDALKPGGLLLYETFLIDNHLRYQHPRRHEFCLLHNELIRLISDLRVLYYNEGPHNADQDAKSVYTAQLVAQKPLSTGPLT